MAAHVVNLLNLSLQRSLRISPVTKRMFLLSQFQFKVFQCRFKSNDVIDEKLFEYYEKYGVSREDAGTVLSKGYTRRKSPVKVEFIERKVDLLIKDCQGNDALFKLLLRNRYVYGYSPDRVKKTLDVLRQDLGCDSDEIVEVFKIVPSIITRNPSDLRSRIERLPGTFDSSLEYIRPFLLKNPNVLMRREKEHIEPLISWLKKMNFSMDEIRELLLVRKKCILINANYGKRISEFLKTEFHFSNDELKLFITTHGGNLSFLTYERLKENVQILREETQISNKVLKAMLLKCIRTISSGSLREKINYLRIDMGLTKEQIIKNCRYLCCSLPRIKSRHQFLLLHGKNIPSLWYIQRPDKMFVKKFFHGVLLQEFEQFKKKYYN